MCGAQQDNSTLCGPSRRAGGIRIADWEDAGGGESGYIAANPLKPDIVFAGSYGGLLTRKDMRTELERDVNPWPDNPMGMSSEDIKYKFQWTFPIVFSPHDPNVMYVGGSQLFVTQNEGQSYRIISPPLARNDPKTLGASGGPITKDQTGVETYGVIFALAESPLVKGVIWAGSDDGLVHVTRDGGITWKNVTPKDIGDFSRISIIEAGHFDAGTAYVAANRYQQDDFSPILYKTTDYGETWTKIVNGIPADEFTRTIREDPVRKGLLYAGHGARRVGVVRRWRRTGSRMRLNLPPVPVHDLAIKEGDLIAATHGRSFWIIDDISPLRQMTTGVAAKAAHLYKPSDAYRIDWGGGFGVEATSTMGPPPPGNKNPPPRACSTNQKTEKPAGTSEFLDAKGNLIKSYNSDSAAASPAAAAAAAAAAAGEGEGRRTWCAAHAACTEQGGAEPVQLEPALPRRHPV